MITMKDFMELVDYRITEGSDYYDDRFGDASYSLTSWNGQHGDGGWSVNIVFSTQNTDVFCAEVCDYQRNRAYRRIHPDYVSQFKEASEEAWDDVKFVDLEEDDDWIQKALAIKSGENYDDRVSVPIDLEDSELFSLMKLAHERDITLNQLVEEILQRVIDQEKLKA